MLRDRPTSSRRERVPPLLIEKLVLGELSPEQAARVRAELENDPEGFDRLRNLRRSNELMLLEHPPRRIVPEIERRAGIIRPKRRSSWMLALPAAVAAAAALALVLHSRPSVVRTAATDGAPDILVKGDPRLLIYKKAGAGTSLLHPGAQVHAHDLLQLTYLAPEQRYGVIFSIDGRGGVTLHYPEVEGQAQTLTAKGEISLAHAYELDDAPTFERFFFVSGNVPIDIDSVLNSARAIASHPDEARQKKLDLPDGLKQYTITLRKESP